MFTFLFLLVIMMTVAYGITLVLSAVWLFILGIWTKVHIPSALAATALLSFMLAPAAGAIGYAVIQDRKHWVDLQAVGGLMLLEIHFLVAFAGINIGWLVWKSGGLYATRQEPVAGAALWAKAGFAGMIANGLCIATTLASLLVSL